MTDPNHPSLRQKIVMHLVTSMPGMSMQYKAYAEAAADEILVMFEETCKEVIGSNFTEVTDYDQAINGVKKMQRQTLAQLLGREDEGDV